MFIRGDASGVRKRTGLIINCERQVWFKGAQIGVGEAIYCSNERPLYLTCVLKNLKKHQVDKAVIKCQIACGWIHESGRHRYWSGYPWSQTINAARKINMPAKNQGVYSRELDGAFLEKIEGIQKSITHQYSCGFMRMSLGKIPKIAATTKPTKPDSHRNFGDQNLYNVSEITQRAIESPKRSNPIPRRPPKNHLAIE